MIEIIEAGPADLDVLSVVIAAAFHDLPPSRWLVEDETARFAIFPEYFLIYLEHGLSAGVVQATADRSAAAVWLPVGPGGPVPPDDYQRSLAAATTPWTARFAAFDAALERRHPAGRPHHHLALLGVRPDRQGRGTGSALLRAGHRALDAAGVPGYLEASSERSRRLYREHGYADLGPPIVLPGGPSLFPMWREPAGG